MVRIVVDEEVSSIIEEQDAEVIGVECVANNRGSAVDQLALVHRVRAGDGDRMQNLKLPELPFHSLIGSPGWSPEVLAARL
jgi:hypothetical protein